MHANLGSEVDYQLGIDVGTTYTAAAVAREGRTEIFSLGDQAAAIPTVVFLGEGGDMVIGEGAARRAISDPDRVARAFKRRIGDQTPILLGGVPVSAESLIARMLRWTVDRVARQEGTKPAAIGVSHPANWGPYKKDLLDQAVQIAGMDVPVATLTEPEAAALHYASSERVEVGDVVAVYDLGGGTFDACVLRKAEEGFEFLGRPEGIERLGGIDFDDAVFDYVLRSVDGGLDIPDPAPPAVIAAATQLRRDCVEAKEALSADTEVTIPVIFPDVQAQVTLSRSEFEGMIQTPLSDTAKALRRALQSAGVGPSEVRKVLLVGGSSKIPLVSEMVSAELGRPVAVDTHPKHSIAFGAGIAAGAALKAAATGAHAPPTAATAPPGAGAPPLVPPAAVTVAGEGPPSITAEPAAAAEPPPSQPPPGPPGRSRRRFALPAAGGLLAAAAAVAAVVLLAGGGDDEAAEEPQPATTATTTAPEPPPAPAGELVPEDWRAVAEAPTARQQVAAASVKGQIFVVGGLLERGSTAKVEVYDPFINTWRAGPDLPEPLHHAMAAAYGGELVVVGGWIPEGPDLVATTSDAAYVLRDGAWQELPPLPEPRAAGAAAAAGGKLVVVGGQDADGQVADTTLVFDGEGWSEGEPLPTLREHLAAASDGRYVYAVGGRNLSAEENSSALERYDPASDSWEELPAMPTARGSLGGAAVIKRDQLVVVGGEEPTGVLATVEAFDISEERWSSLPDIPTPRHGAAVVGVGKSVYVIGGATGAGHSASTKAAEAFDFSVGG